jgi:hypothetical protein
VSVVRQGNRSSWLVVAVSYVVAVLFCAVASKADAAFSEYGLDSVSVTESTTQAGAHPDVTIDFNLKTDPASEPDSNGNRQPFARVRTVKVDMPPGVMGNPNAVPKCTVEQFASYNTGGEGCPLDTQVGITRIRQYNFFVDLTEPIFNMETPNEDTVARLGFYSATLPYFINVNVRSDYGLTATIENPPSAEVAGVTTELWGVPADPSHDNMRLTPKEAYPGAKEESPLRPSGLDPAPFMTNPTTCNQPLRLRITTDSYQEPGVYSSLEAPFPTITGCDKLEFKPEFSAQPTSREAGGPTGLDTTLKVPQNETPYGLATSHLRGATVELPAGMTISPGAADGLAACSAEQVHFGTEFTSECPDAAKIGTAEFDVPALARRMQGSIYQRTPEPGHLFRLWLVSDELGVHVKIPGEIHADKSTGQLTASFENTPQVPVRELDLHFKSGGRGVLTNPPACGAYQTRYEFTPWSGNPSVAGTAPMTINEGCAAQPFSPRLNAGTVSPSAGGFSPFVLDLSLDSRGHNILGFDVELPQGLLAKLAGVPLCAAAAAAGGNCDPSTQVGTVNVGVGPGPAPLWIPQAGKAPTGVYLAGPYKGAPYSLVVKVPAQAGPFDLGTVVTRAGLHVDSTTTQVTVKTDPLPQILEGVPISYRSIRVHTDRDRFTLNPTSCDPTAVEARVTSTGGAVAEPSSRFQVAGCERLKFRPKLSLRLKGATRRAGYPALTAVLRTRPNEANLRRVSVALPHSEFLAQNHIRTVCTRVQFRAGNCPKGSIYGFARVTTPLLDKPLQGPVYLRSSSNPLPDLVLALRGQIDVDLAGRIDSVRGGIRTTFNAIPDAPISRFVLKMKGGKKGLLQNSRNICGLKPRARVKIDGQNGKVADQAPRLIARCKG